MPPRSKVQQLPDDVRQELERKLIQNGFADYYGLEDWLTDKGYEISKSAIQRFGSTFKERCDMLRMATQQAKTIVEEMPDDEGAMTEALMRLMQERLFDALVHLEVDPKKINLGSIAKAVAPIARANIAQKEFATKVRERARAAGDVVEKLTRSGALTAAGGEEIRAAILGIAGSAP